MHEPCVCDTSPTDFDGHPQNLDYSYVSAGAAVWWILVLIGKVRIRNVEMHPQITPQSRSGVINVGGIDLGAGVAAGGLSFVSRY
jgi:hypothetical protein